MLLSSLSIPEFGPKFFVTCFSVLGGIVDELGLSRGSFCFFLMKSMVCLCDVDGLVEDNSWASCCSLGLKLSLVCLNVVDNEAVDWLRNLWSMMLDGERSSFCEILILTGRNVICKKGYT